MISEFRHKNIMSSDCFAKNYRIPVWRVLSVSEFDGKKLFHLVNASFLLITSFWCYFLPISDFWA